MLKPALARGELQCIGASTLNEYRKYIEKDGALERRFQPVIVEPPSVDETVEILKGLRKKYEDHHRVVIPDATLERRGEARPTATSPTASCRTRPSTSSTRPARARGSRRRCRRPRSRSSRRAGEGEPEKEEAIRDQNFERAAELRD